MAKKHVYSASLEDIASLFEEAADTGQFIFEDVPYADFIAFIKEHSANFSIQVGKRDQEVIDELNRLKDLALSLAKA